MFIDEVKIYVKAGNGGNGCVSFRREKYIEDGGPDGGSGGRGGNIKIVADNNINTLLKLRYSPHHKAQSGERGKGQKRTGASGEDYVITVPVGTDIMDENREVTLYSLTTPGAECVIAKGGKGGAGNSVFKSSTNQAPKKAIPGEIGEEGTFVLRLRLLADVGLVGMPNAGKSSFLASVSEAKPKIADYPFTTLVPMLGYVAVDFVDGFVLADIPGLIENASKGSGLGDRFLKHIERCNVLLHLIDITNPDFVKNYKMIRKELKEYQYQNGLDKKREIVVLNKIDMMDEEDMPKIKKEIAKLEKLCKSKVFLVSALTKKGLKPLISTLFSAVKEGGNK